MPKPHSTFSSSEIDEAREEANKMYEALEAEIAKQRLQHNMNLGEQAAFEMGAIWAFKYIARITLERGLVRKAVDNEDPSGYTN